MKNLHLPTTAIHAAVPTLMAIAIAGDLQAQRRPAGPEGEDRARDLFVERLSEEFSMLAMFDLNADQSIDTVEEGALTAAILEELEERPDRDSRRPSRSPDRNRSEEETERPERAPRERTERDDGAERPERAERRERIEAQERPERGERASREERGERAAPGERFERAERATNEDRAVLMAARMAAIYNTYAPFDLNVSGTLELEEVDNLLLAIEEGIVPPPHRIGRPEQQEPSAEEIEAPDANEDEPERRNGPTRGRQASRRR